VPAGSLGGVVWDAGEQPLAGADIAVLYEYAPEPVRAAAAEVARETEGAGRAGPVPPARLLQNFPNPYLNFTRLVYELDHAGLACIELFTHRGEHFATLLDSTEVTAGTHSLILVDLPSDVYVARLSLTTESGTTVSLVHGITCLPVNPVAARANTVTGASGEFDLPRAELACGLRIPLTTAEGPERTGWARISDLVRVVARSGLRMAHKDVLLNDDSVRFYVELMLPPAP
jgi:hypothetical protein